MTVLNKSHLGFRTAVVYHQLHLKHLARCRAMLLTSALLCTSAGFGQDRQPSLAGSGNDAFRISIDVRLVVLPVSVTDRNGHAVPDLRPEDFRVYENGRLQKLALFSHEDVPVTVGLVVDNSSSMVPKRWDVIEAVLAFARSSNSQDQMFVVNFSEKPSFGLPANVPFTNRASLLRQCVGATPGGHTALYDAVVLGLEHLKQGTCAKKALIIVSDGGDNASHHRLSEVVHMAETASALIYTVGLLDEHEMDQNPGVLRRIANATGGGSYFPDTPLGVETTFQEIARDLREQYTLAHVPPSPDDTKSYRKIRVQVVAAGRGKVRVRTRNGYYMPVSTGPSEPKREPWN